MKLAYRKFLSEHKDHEKAPVARYGLGVSLFRMGDYDAVVEELTPLRGLSPFQYAAEVRTILGQCHLARQGYAEAARAFKDVVDGHADHDLADEAAAGMVEALYLDGKYDEAYEGCERVAGRWPESPLRERTEFLGALATMAQHEYAAAAQRFEGLLARYPQGPFVQQASLLLAQCYQQNNAVENAIRQYRKVLAQAGSRYIPDALLGLAMLLQGKGNAEEAGTFLDQLLDRFPTSPLVRSARLQRGRAYFEQAQFGRAFEMFRQVADEGGADGDQAAYWMAKCKLREGDFVEAASRFVHAAEAFPTSDILPEMFFDRAVALVRAERYDDAVAALESYRTRFPDHALAAEALHLLAATEHKRGRYDESRKHCLGFLGRYAEHELAPAIAFLLAEDDFLDGQYERAVESCRSFLARHSADAQVDKAKFRLGTALYRLHRFDEAKDVLAGVSKGGRTEETFRPALLYLGDIHFQRSEWKQAEGALGDYVSFGLDIPSADDALLKLGISLQRQGRNERALEAYDRLIASFADSPHRLQALFERSQALVALERLDEAAEAFKSVLAQGGDSRFAPHALNHLANIAMRHGQYEETAELYERVTHTAGGAELEADAMFQAGQALMAAQQFAKAEAAFASCLEKYPLHTRAVEARAQRAIAVSRQNRHAEAVEAIEQVERQSGAKLDPSMRGALRYEKAWCLRELGKSEEAAKAYQGLLDEGLAGDFNTHALLELAGIEMNAKRLEEAAKLLRRLREVIRAAPDDTPREIREQATYRLAVCEFESERFKDASELFEEFVDAFPDSPLMASASFYCGEALFKERKYEKAVTHLTRIAEDFENDPALGPGLLRLGECLAALQRWARSEQVFTRYMDRFGDSEFWFQAQFGIGWARENQKRYDEAVSAYRDVAARHQGVTAARAQFQIGECLFAQDRHEEAVRELLKVDILHAYPEWSAAALYEAGRCFERLGKTVEARSHFKQVAEEYKKTRWADLASQRLSELSAASLPGH